MVANRTRVFLRCAGVTLICLWMAASDAQVFFSVKPDYVRVKRNGTHLRTTFQSQFPDTAISGLHNYLPRNLFGNPGLPSPSYLLRYGTPDLGFRFFDPPYERDRYREKEIPFYSTSGPYASLTGVAGSKEFQLFNALFTQTYRNRINLALGFRRYTSLGYYSRQQTYTNNFFLSSNYAKQGNRFGYYFYFLNNSHRHNENGGIRDEFLDDSTLLVPKELLDVRFGSASRDNRQNVIQLNPHVMLGPRHDSLGGFRPVLSLKSRYSGEAFKYVHRFVKDDLYYRDVFFSDTTHDSTHVRQFTNELSALFPVKQGDLQIGLRHELSRVWQVSDSVLDNRLFVSHYSWQRTPDSTRTGLKFNADVQYVLAGSNQHNRRLELVGERTGKSNGVKWRLFFLTEIRNPDQLYRRWTSNHFIWDGRALLPQELTEARLGISPFPWLSLSVHGRTIGNFLYFDSQAYPAQTEQPVQMGALEMYIEKLLWNHLGIELRYMYQYTTASSVVRLPAHYLHPKLYYNTFLFRNRMQVLMGVEAELFDTFAPYAYMPATQVFYPQNDIRVGPYPFADLFFSVRIRPVSVFFKLENALKGFAGPDYFLVPGYYQPDRAFRLGINWMFFD